MDPIMCARTECTSTMFCIWPDDVSMSRNMSPNCYIDYQYMLCLLTEWITLLNDTFITIFKIKNVEVFFEGQTGQISSQTGHTGNSFCWPKCLKGHEISYILSFIIQTPVSDASLLEFARSLCMPTRKQR
jgi:hypothetical protein